MAFCDSRLKIKWAYKHILDINSAVLKFTASDDFYTLAIEYDDWYRTNHLRFDIHTDRFPGADIALMIGDVLHNLRSGLDLLWYETVLRCGGEPSNFTRFPIRETRDQLESGIKTTLNKKQITTAISDIMLDTINPHATGNPVLWGLHDLNDRDKHQLLIPVLQLMKFDGICLINEHGMPVHENFWFIDESCTIRLPQADDMRITIKDKGYSAATILFDNGIAFQGEAVIPTLHRIAEEALRTIEAFEILLGN